jgi:pyruvate/2-oxoglutarate dehydrogenase complex dihydrolipoamide acyltransferase (E2) component
MIELTLPDLGGLAFSATITTWEKAPGEWVGRDDVICRVAVGGQEMQVHSTADGYLARHLAGIGHAVRGGDSLAEVGAPGETRLRAVPDELAGKVPPATQPPPAPPPAPPAGFDPTRRY